MKFRFSAGLVAVASLLVSCSPKPSGATAVLNAEVIGDCSEVIVITYPKAGQTDYLFPEISDGHFRLELEDVEDFIDCGVALDGEVYGARINAGDSLQMVCKATGDGKYDIAYTGATERESRIWTDFYDTYGYFGQYNIRPDRDPEMTTADALALLAGKDAAFRNKYGSTLDEYYIHRADLMCDFFKSVLLEYEADDAGSDVRTNPEYAEIMEKVDPEDPMSISCGLLGRWVHFNTGSVSDDPIDAGISFMEGSGAELVSDAARLAAADVLSAPVFSHIDFSQNERYTGYLEKLEAYLPGHPEIISAYREKLEDAVRAATLTAIPDVAMQAPDGSEVMLSSLFGKVIYIDMWATWCGPCLREAPYMEKLAEKYRKDDRFAFISISVDETAEPWLEKIAADKPFWPQYRVDGKKGADFFKGINLQTIPRFIIIDRDGNVFDVDAPRPSNAAVTESLEKAARRNP